MQIQTPDITRKIRELNDTLRTTFTGGILVMTRGVATLTLATRLALLDRVQKFDAFDEGNDVHAEHDFGHVDLDGERYFFKIDYLDRSMESGSPDPSDPRVTKRIITLMRSEEY